MANGSTTDRQGLAVEYLTGHAPELLNLVELRKWVDDAIAFPKLAPLRERMKVVKAAQVILAAGIESVLPTVTFLHKPDLERELYLVRMLANWRPDAHEEAMTRCRDSRARLAFGLANYCESYHLPQFGPRFVLEAAIAWEIEPPPPAKRFPALLRAWQRRVKDARILAKWSRDATWDQMNEGVTPEAIAALERALLEAWPFPLQEDS